MRATTTSFSKDLLPLVSAQFDFIVHLSGALEIYLCVLLYTEEKVHQTRVITVRAFHAHSTLLYVVAVFFLQCRSFCYRWCFAPYVSVLVFLIGSVTLKNWRQFFILSICYSLGLFMDGVYLLYINKRKTFQYFNFWIKSLWLWLAIFSILNSITSTNRLCGCNRLNYISRFLLTILMRWMITCQFLAGRLNKLFSQKYISTPNPIKRWSWRLKKILVFVLFTLLIQVALTY